MDTFRIPKKKRPSDCEPAHVLMQSPLSCLQPSTPNVKSGYGEPSSKGRAERRQAGSTLGSSSNKRSTPCKPFFGDVVKTLLGLKSPTKGAPSANQGAAGSGSQPASSACFSNGWRPKRASDRLLSPGVTPELESPPQKKRTVHSGSQLPDKRISVASLDPLAELRAEKQAGSLTLSGSQGPADQRSDRRRNSFGPKEKKKNSSPSTSSQSSEDDFLSPPRTKAKPSACHSRGAVSTATATRTPPSGRARPSTSSDVRDDLREEERQKWRRFREKKMASRSAVFSLHPRKPRHHPSEPIVLSSEEEDEDEGEGNGDRADGAGTSEPAQAQQAVSCVPSPSFLQLEFNTLQAGLITANANGTMTITEHGITLPLKGAEEAEVEVVVVASHLRGYGVWDGSLAGGGSLLAGCGGPAPSLLFLWVTDAQANLLQMELSTAQTSAAASAPPCSILLLVLEKQLQELETALLASVLDMEEYRKGYSTSSFSSPLTWADGQLLVHSCPPPLDQHLLRLLGCSAEKPSQLQSSQRSKKAGLKAPSPQPQPQQLPARLIQYPPPPYRGRITVTREDLACLDAGEFLNDVIIDFYLKFLVLEGVGGPVCERAHVFSSFFYKQLSRRRAAGENHAPSVPDRHVRHQRVKTWTRHVDIFTKDFLFVPVNQEAHWFLVVVCFPALEDVQYESFPSPAGVSGRPERAAGKSHVSLRSQQTPECLERDCRRDTVLKRPCILVMDSLKLSNHDNVCRLLRDYLQVEWEVRRGTPRLFTPDTMRSSNCRVPQQDNSSDCGLYLLQYAESFLQNPVVHFELPVRLDNWFPRQQVRQKREEIRSLIMEMHQSQTERR